VATLHLGSDESRAAMDPIRAEAIRTMYDQMHNTAFAAVVITLYMIATAAPFTAWLTIAIWVVAQIAVQLLRAVMLRAFRRSAPSDDALLRWAHIFLAHQALVGLLWGATIFLFFHPGEPITLALVLCCLYSIAAGGVPAQAYYPPSLYIMVGVASSLFAVTMAGFCRIQSRAVAEGFRIRFENIALVEALTEQKAAADEARHKAELASLAKSQFLAAASHDLRQPLYALSLFSASLDELRLDAEGKAVVGNIQDSIAVMESLFDGLLDVSKLEAGVVRPRLAAVSADAMFDRLSQVFRPIALERGLDLRFRSNGEWVRSDSALLEQVLSNFVSNALRCTPKGGILVAARTRRDEVLFEVWDTGTGISDEDRERIFEEFVQLGNPERDRRKGLGLGLSIARRAAALIDGQISLASRLGLGSRFGLAQPRGTALLATGTSNDLALTNNVATIARSHDLPVLLVDDDRDVRAALGDLLGRWGVHYEAFADADTALARIAAGGRFGLTLADYRLSGNINGLELIAAIAVHHPAPQPPAVLITGDFDAALLAAADACGVPLLHKPLRPADLRVLLGLSRAAVRS
jgi:signal transduction histidine kinase/ActR/RegA family two-component response regulator